jgi:hypothetical protein
LHILIFPFHFARTTLKMIEQNSEEKPSKNNWVQILEQPLYTRRKLRMICLGAGFSGLTLAHKLRYDLKYEDFIDLQIYEKNADLGGTWYENRYPGAAW